MYDVRTREISPVPKGTPKAANISIAPVKDTPVVSGLDNLADKTLQSGCAGPAIWEDFYFKFTSGNILYAVKGAGKNGGGK